MTAKEIISSLPERFKPDSASEDLHIVFHFDITGDQGGQYSVEIKNKQCSVSEGLHGDPKCTVKTSAKTYEEIELGKTNAQMAFMMGKIQISNISAMLKFIDCFERLH